MWGRPYTDNKNEEEGHNEGRNISYKTECPIYDPSLLLNEDMAGIGETNKIVESNVIQSQVKSFYPLNLNIYNNDSATKGFHPYYPSMDKNSMVRINTFYFNFL